MIASCGADGIIRLGKSIPKGCLEITRGPAKQIRDLIEANARLAYDNKTLLVPGVPEAPNQMAGMNALLAFIRRLKARKPLPGVKLAGDVPAGEAN